MLPDPPKIQHSLKNSFRDGIFASVMTGFTEQYLAPFAIALQASAQAIGFLAALPNLVASLSQLFFNYWVHRFGGRRTFIALARRRRRACCCPSRFFRIGSCPAKSRS